MNTATTIYTYLAPIMAIILLIDFFQMPKSYDRQDTITNFSIFGVSAGIKTCTKFFEVGAYFFFFDHLMNWRELNLGYDHIPNHWWTWVLGFLLADLMYYWFHRLGHEIRLLWANHIVHHSSEHYNFTTSIRISWWTHFFKFLFWSPLAILGFHPILIMYTMALVDSYQFFLHTQHTSNFGILEKVFNTPRLHAVHHAKNPEYIDKNYGGVLIIWDRLFGTFQPVISDVDIQFGVSIPPEKNTTIDVVTHEFVNIWKDLKKVTCWKEKWKVLFYSPAWSVYRFTKKET